MACPSELGWNVRSLGEELHGEAEVIAGLLTPGAQQLRISMLAAWADHLMGLGVGNCYVNIMPSKQLVIAVMGNDSGLGTGGGWSSFQSLANRITD